MPLSVIRTRSRSIWDDLNPFVEKLIGAYRYSQEVKWENEWTSARLLDLENALKKPQAEDILKQSVIPEDNLDLEHFKGFAKDSLSLLAMKEIEMNPEDFTKGVSTSQRTTQTIPDKKEFNDLYKFVSELPTGKVDWVNTIEAFKKRLESGRAMGSAAQQFLNMIIGQSMPVNQRQKVQQDFNFAQDIQSELFPETFDEEAFYKEHPEMELKGATSTGHKTYGKKAEPKDELKIDVMKFLEEHKDEWEFGNINSKGDFTIRRKDTTKKYDFETYSEAQQWCKANPQKGFDWAIDPQPEGFNVRPMKKTVTPGGGTKKLVPTYQTINTISEDLTNPDLDYDTTMHNAEIKYNLEGVKLPTKADQARVAYDMFEGIILHEDNEFIDEKGRVKDPEGYTDFYKDYEKFSEIYFKETGEILPKKYLSIEEAGVWETNQWALGKAKGGAKTVRNEDSIPWGWQKKVDVTQEVYNQIQRANIELIKQGKSPLTLDDFNLEELAKRGVDIDRLRTIFNK